MIGGRPTSLQDLQPSERRLLETIRALGFGQIEFLRIRAGEPVLHPWPTVVHHTKFGATQQEQPRTISGANFDLKREAAELFEYTRQIEDGEIRVLMVRHGLPFTMQCELTSRGVDQAGGRHA